VATIWKKLNRFLRALGPGLITGAADDDPSGIATYTQTGAQFGFGQLWIVAWLLPFMTAIQEACARIGAVTGKGIAAVIKEHYSKTVLYITVALIVLANTINIGADLGAMGAAARLIIPIPVGVLTLFFTALILILEIFTSYKTYSKLLKWLALTLLAYPITLALVHAPWHTILYATFVPHVTFSFAFLFIITGVLGTTISPYMFFWEASEEVEEEKKKRLIKHGKAKPTKWFMHSLEIDNLVGMVTSNAVTWCIVIVAAVVLNGSGVTNVQSAADAAHALLPLVQTFPYAGFLAQLIFALGIIGLGLLAVPILSASASYALSESLQWKEGLNLKLKHAHGFYGIITIATVLGLSINFIGIDPVKALIYSAVLNGIAAVPLIFIIARIAGNKKIMGNYASGRISKTLVWITFGFMTLAAIALLYTISTQ
jgi:NRAMP (natural resistance-associated macrophage protein)-like metal ion transporter